MDLRLTQLEELLPISSYPEHQKLLNKLDTETGNILTSGEKKRCSVFRHFTDPFSTELQKALCNNRQCKMALAKILSSSGNGVTSASDLKQEENSWKELKKMPKKCKTST